MTVVLADTSVWAREHQPTVAALLTSALRGNRLAIVLPIALEILRSMPDARAFRLQARRLGWLHQINLSPTIEHRASEIQAALAKRGYHRGTSPTDLVAAAAAEAAEAELWHCDRHFELIAEVTGQPMRRVGE